MEEEEIVEELIDDFDNKNFDPIESESEPIQEHKVDKQKDLKLEEPLKLNLDENLNQSKNSRQNSLISEKQEESEKVGRFSIGGSVQKKPSLLSIKNEEYEESIEPVQKNKRYHEISVVSNSNDYSANKISLASSLSKQGKSLKLSLLSEEPIYHAPKESIIIPKPSESKIKKPFEMEILEDIPTEKKKKLTLRDSSPNTNKKSLLLTNVIEKKYTKKANKIFAEFNPFPLSILGVNSFNKKLIKQIIKCEKFMQQFKCQNTIKYSSKVQGESENIKKLEAIRVANNKLIENLQFEQGQIHEKLKKTMDSQSNTRIQKEIDNLKKQIDFVKKDNFNMKNKNIENSKNLQFYSVSDSGQGGIGPHFYLYSQVKDLNLVQTKNEQLREMCQKEKSKLDATINEIEELETMKIKAATVAQHMGIEFVNQEEKNLRDKMEELSKREKQLREDLKIIEESSENLFKIKMSELNDNNKQNNILRENFNQIATSIETMKLETAAIIQEFDETFKNEAKKFNLDFSESHWGASQQNKLDLVQMTKKEPRVKSSLVLKQNQHPSMDTKASHSHLIFNSSNSKMPSFHQNLEINNSDNKDAGLRLPVPDNSKQPKKFSLSKISDEKPQDKIGLILADPPEKKEIQIVDKDKINHTEAPAKQEEAASSKELSNPVPILPAKKNRLKLTDNQFSNKNNSVENQQEKVQENVLEISSSQKKDIIEEKYIEKKNFSNDLNSIAPMTEKNLIINQESNTGNNLFTYDWSSQATKIENKLSFEEPKSRHHQNTVPVDSNKGSLTLDLPDFLKADPQLNSWQNQSPAPVAKNDEIKNKESISLNIQKDDEVDFGFPKKIELNHINDSTKVKQEPQALVIPDLDTNWGNSLNLGNDNLMINQLSNKNKDDDDDFVADLMNQKKETKNVAAFNQPLFENEKKDEKKEESKVGNAGRRNRPLRQEISKEDDPKKNETNFFAEFDFNQIKGFFI